MKKKPLCPRCGSSQVITRKKHPRRRCRVCGAEFDRAAWRDIQKNA